MKEKGDYVVWPPVTCARNTKRSKRCINMRPDTRQQHPSGRGEAKQEAEEFPNNRFFCHRDILVLVGILVSVACAPALFFFFVILIHKGSTETDELKFRQMAKQDERYNAALFRMRPRSLSPSFFPPVADPIVWWVLGCIDCSHIKELR